MYEIEVKVLLQTREAADKLLENIAHTGLECRHIGDEKQLNHYFTGGKLPALAAEFRDRLSVDEHEALTVIAMNAKDYSVRTRDTVDERILVVKASINNDSSELGLTRREWEAKFTDLTIDEIDALVLGAGFEYLSKWSRERETYELENGITLVIDKNAGYGYVAEFERVIDDEKRSVHERDYIIAVIESLGFHEFDHDLHTRMFEHYNARWREYYGTDKTFSLE
jgi:adenylate cyclase class IV